MSVFTSIMIKHLLPIIEEAFVAHEPFMQAALLNEVQDLSARLNDWIESKMTAPEQGETHAVN